MTVPEPSLEMPFHMTMKRFGDVCCCVKMREPVNVVRLNSGIHIGAAKSFGTARVGIAAGVNVRSVSDSRDSILTRPFTLTFTAVRTLP